MVQKLVIKINVGFLTKLSHSQCPYFKKRKKSFKRLLFLQLECFYKLLLKFEMNGFTSVHRVVGHGPELLVSVYWKLFTKFNESQSSDDTFYCTKTVAYISLKLPNPRLKEKHLFEHLLIILP